MKITRILIVEDEGIVALDIQSMLRNLGYQVVGVVDSGEAAIEMAGREQPDLTLMDIRLRGDMDGIETARQLRARFDIPVVYLTAYADEVTLSRAKVTEPLGYLVKPFEERDLHSTLEMVLYKIEMDMKLRAQVARLQRIMATVPEGVALLDEARRVVFANARASEYLANIAGVREGESIDWLGGTSFEQLAKVSSGNTWQEITLSHSASHRVFEAHVSAAADGESAEWVLVIREVTEEREMGQRMKLQDRIATIGQFSAGIAHDLNNILASIIIEPYMLRKLEPNMSKKAQDRLESISRQARRGSDLISQILEFSRGSQPELRLFEPVPLFKELSKMLERILPESIQFELISNAQGFMLNGDATRIMQLLMNLTLNARDAMPNGGLLTIEVDVVSGEAAKMYGLHDGEEWLRIYVSDSGTGIHPDVLPHIFEPFFTTKETGKGNGLGLSQVAEIVEQHRGHIIVDSQLNAGTSCTVYFPAIRTRPAGLLGQEPAEPPPPEGEQQTIILVDDNPDVRMALQGILEVSNYRVLPAANGQEALAIFDRHRHVDLILTDLDMPRMTGLEMCRELRSVRNDQDVRIIVFTGYVSEDDMAELKSLAITRLLTKPLEVEQLLQSIAEVLEAASTAVR
ncbi:MAG: response regulator [Chloroflexi bacterium]|nr:response regulator [Chloroflexota bacterium]